MQTQRGVDAATLAELAWGDDIWNRLIEALKASPYNLLSRWADATPPGHPDEALKTRHVEATHRNFGEFKVPGLRQVARTAPYMHDGQLATLEAVADQALSTWP